MQVALIFFKNEHYTLFAILKYTPTGIRSVDRPRKRSDKGALTKKQQAHPTSDDYGDNNPNMSAKIGGYSRRPSTVYTVLWSMGSCPHD